MAKKKVTAIFQLKVGLRGIEPPVWRSIQLPEDTTLARVHRILQSLFNWDDYHLHDFRPAGAPTAFRTRRRTPSTSGK